MVFQLTSSWGRVGVVAVVGHHSRVMGFQGIWSFKVFKCIHQNDPISVLRVLLPSSGPELTQQTC